MGRAGHGDVPAMRTGTVRAHGTIACRRKSTRDPADREGAQKKQLRNEGMLVQSTRRKSVGQRQRFSFYSHSGFACKLAFAYQKEGNANPRFCGPKRKERISIIRLIIINIIIIPKDTPPHPIPEDPKLRGGTEVKERLTWNTNRRHEGHRRLRDTLSRSISNHGRHQIQEGKHATGI